MKKSLQQQTFQGIQWSFLTNAVQFVMQIVTASCMSRLVSPKAFGLLAMAQLFLRFSMFFSEFGIGLTLVQKKEISEEEIRSGFTLTVLLGVGFCALMLFGAQYSFLLMDSNELPTIIRILSFGMIFNGASVVGFVLLRRELKFKEMGLVDLFSFSFSYYFLGIPLAFLGFDIWALVCVSLIQPISGFLMRYYLTRHSLMPHFSLIFWKELLMSGAQLSMISSFLYLMQGSDQFIVGNVFGDYQLGVYTRCQLLVSLPLNSVVSSIFRVLFSSLAKIQDESEKLRNVFSKGLLFFCALVFPTGFIFFSLSSEIIEVVLGSRWLTGKTILEVNSLTIPVVCLSSLYLTFLDSKGFYKEHLYIEVLSFLFLVPMLLVGAKWGIVGIAVGALCGQVVRFLMFQVACARMLQIPFAAFLKALSRSILISIMVVSFIQLFLIFLAPKNCFLRLLGGGGVSIFAYGLGLVLFGQTILSHLRELVKGKNSSSSLEKLFIWSTSFLEK